MDENTNMEVIMPSIHEIPDYNLFMCCREPNREAAAKLPDGYKFDLCRPNELDIWKRFPFDREVDADSYYGYMTEYFDNVYGANTDEFYRRCLFVRSSDGTPVATGFVWRAYGRVNTLHWIKTRRDCENLGIGRALLTRLLIDTSDEYPICLHTQPSSFRAIKLYSDFGFEFITDDVVGSRKNQLRESLPWLKEFMLPEAFAALRYTTAPQELLEAAAASEINEF